MNIKRLLHSLGIGAGALIICTFIYAAIDMSRISNIGDEVSLNNYFKDHHEAVVEFYNPDCPVCQAFKKSGIFPKSAETLPDIGFAMVSKVEGAELQKKYNIEWFPTFIYFRDGKEFHRTTGYTTNPKFTDNIKEAFAQEKG